MVVPNSRDFKNTNLNAFEKWNQNQVVRILHLQDFAIRQTIIAYSQRFVRHCHVTKENSIEKQKNDTRSKCLNHLVFTKTERQLNTKKEVN